MNTVPILAASTTVIYNVELKVDPCVSGYFTPDSLDDMYYLVDPATPEYIEQSFNSLVYNLNSGADIDCGPILYKLVGNGSNDWITMDEVFRTISVKGSNEHIGTYNLKVTAELARYPKITPLVGVEMPFVVTVETSCLNAEFLEPNWPELMH